MHIRLSSLLLIILIFTLVLASIQEVFASTETLRPNAAGDSTQLTPSAAPNWDCVNDIVSDSDATYVVSPSTTDVAQLDLYNIENTNISAGSTINNVTVSAYVRSSSATYKASFRIALKKSGGTTQYGAIATPSTTYTLISKTFTGILQTDLNALQIGIEIASGYNDRLETYTPGRCTQVYADVDYTLVSASWNTVSTWSVFLVTRSWQTSGTWSEFLQTRAWNTITSWSNFLITRSWQNVATWSIILLTPKWNSVTTWSILLLGDDPTNIVVILFLFSVVAFTGIGLYRRKKKA